MAVALGRLDRDDPLAAAPVHGKFLDGGELAVAVLGSDQDQALGIRDDQRNDAFAFGHADAPYAGRVAAHGADVLLREADGLAVGREQHDVAAAVGDVDADEAVAGIEAERDDSGQASA